MPVFRIPKEHVFPDPSFAEPDGLLGIGGDLDPARLVLAYQNGIFPWYSEGQPILWFSPDPRFVIDRSSFRIQRSLRKVLRKRPYDVVLEEDFATVVRACKDHTRPGQRGTWITEDLEAAYHRLHRAGLAHAVGSRDQEGLAGGLYGIGLGGLFSGESMFSARPDASKVAFSTLAMQLWDWGFELIDCQVYTDHLARFGAYPMPRDAYVARVRELVRRPGRVGPWSFDPGFAPAW